MKNLTKLITNIILSPQSFIFFSIFLIIYNVVGMYLLFSWGSYDIWEHMAAMNSFSTNLINPPNPYIISDYPTHLFTPYHLFWGGIAKILNIHIFWLFPIISGINILLFVISIKVFSRRFLFDDKYTLILALTMLFFWIKPWGYSGVYSFELLPLTTVYPYWFSLPISLLLISFYGESDFRIKKHYAITFEILTSVLISFVFLSHPLTGSFLILSLFIKATLANSITLFERIKLMILPIFGFLLALLWPYFPVSDTIIGSASFEAVGFADNWELFYKYSLVRILPALLGFPYLIYLLVNKKLTYINVTLVVTIFIYLLNYLLFHNTLLSRYIIFIALLCQAGLVMTLKYLEYHRLFNSIISGFLFITLILSIPQVISSADRIGLLKDALDGKPFGTYSNVSTFHQYSILKFYIGKNDVLMAPMRHSWVLAGLIGCRVVGVMHSNPFMHDFFERKKATENFFLKGATNTERFKTIKQYSVKFILVLEDSINNFSDILPYLNPIYKEKGYTLFSIKPL